MKRITIVAIFLGLVALAPSLAFAAPPVPVETEVVDLQNDNGTTLGVLWKWQGDANADTRVWVLITPDEDTVSQFEMTPDSLTRLSEECSKLQQNVSPMIAEIEAAEVALADAQEKFQVASVNSDPETAQIRRDMWAAQNSLDKLLVRRNKYRDSFTDAAGPLALRKQSSDFLTASIARNRYLPSDKAGETIDGIGTKGGQPRNFGINAAEGDKLLLTISGLRASNPKSINGTFVTGEFDDYDQEERPGLLIPLSSGSNYSLQMMVYQNPNPDAELSFAEVLALEDKVVVDLGGGQPNQNFFDTSKVNNFVFALLFGLIIMGAIILARKNPNLFIRRIQGLEAVDEAIGRATEMGKPVLYLCGLMSLSELPTLAAVSILGRVARRIADYDSDLIVPCRDPVVLTVAQEVVKEAYVEQGRPDAYRADNIFFLTEDQFSFTASTCAIMMRDKPAANFFMGYYYAESLLLAETGASTGAIQIAGTDALHQLPFFITTCDYTLIGEELYAASAYLSREPMLLGSLKGQDVGKAFILLLIIFQTILFMFSENYDWLRVLVEPIK